jgi:hypothetical protein
MKSREEQLTWAKQRALICVDIGDFSDAVAGLRLPSMLEGNPDAPLLVERVYYTRDGDA